MSSRPKPPLKMKEDYKFFNANGEVKWPVLLYKVDKNFKFKELTSIKKPKDKAKADQLIENLKYVSTHHFNGNPLAPKRRNLNINYECKKSTKKSSLGVQQTAMNEEERLFGPARVPGSVVNGFFTANTSMDTVYVYIYILHLERFEASKRKIVALAEEELGSVSPRIQGSNLLLCPLLFNGRWVLLGADSNIKTYWYYDPFHEENVELEAKAALLSKSSGTTGMEFKSETLGTSDKVATNSAIRILTYAKKYALCKTKRELGFHDRVLDAKKLILYELLIGHCVDK